jgi:hypothetical protein
LRYVVLSEWSAGIKCAVECLQEAIERSAANFRKATGIEVRMAIDPDHFLSQEM